MCGLRVGIPVDEGFGRKAQTLRVGLPVAVAGWLRGRRDSGMPSTPGETGPDVISDEELQKISIGELKLHNAPITLVEYELSWPRLFAREADRIRVVLGDTALRIEHVGSTSVPGLAAKPIIDILLAVANSADESSYVPNLEAAGYV